MNPNLKRFRYRVSWNGATAETIYWARKQSLARAILQLEMEFISCGVPFVIRRIRPKRKFREALIRQYVKDEYYASEESDTSIKWKSLFDNAHAKRKMVGIIAEYCVPVKPWESIVVIVYLRGKFWGRWDVDEDTWRYTVN